MEKRIISLLKKTKGGLSLPRIAGAIRVSRRDRRKLLEQLKEMGSQGILMRLKRRYFLAPSSRILKGELVTVLPGFGFVTPESGKSGDIFIPGRDLGGALQGDTVELAVQEAGRRGKPEGKVVKIARKGRDTLLGLYQENYGLPCFRPLEGPFAEEISLRMKEKVRLQAGTIIEVDRETKVLKKVLGKPDDPGVDTQVIIRNHNLATRFSRGALAEAELIPGGLPVELKGRRDLRDWTTMTIDGEDAQDFDDAVSIKRIGRTRHLLGVHIADVSHYVPGKSALDGEADERGTSVYFPDLTLPMLPERLSNDICSLRPKVPRLTVSVLLEFDESAEVQSVEFFPSLIQTAERMTYTSVFKILEGDKEEKRKYAALVSDLLMMRDLARSLRKKRNREGSLDFDILEPELIYKAGRLQSVARLERNEAHQLIEEFMVAANVAVATYFVEKGLPAVYRIHPKPSPADLAELREALTHFGLLLPEAGTIESSDLQRVLSAVKGKPVEKFVNILVLRALKLAVYSERNVGHYGLAKKNYTHFTSPIRRYPDLVVHRILKRALEGKKPALLPLEAIALKSSRRERNADEAEKALVEWRILRLLKERLGDEFEGLIVDRAKTGFVVELDGYFVDGLLPQSAVERGSLRARSGPAGRARRGGQRFELGQRLRVILAAVDPLQRRLTFSLSSEQEVGSR